MPTKKERGLHDALHDLPEDMRLLATTLLSKAQIAHALSPGSATTRPQAMQAAIDAELRRVCAVKFDGEA